MQYKNNLLYRLTQYSKDGLTPFHMPGHKRNENMIPLDAYNIDITEIDGFDDLHHPEECLKDAMKRATRIYKSKHTFFLVNGCTGGILAAISAVCKHGDKLLLARNSHKSAYNAALINGLETIYLYAEDEYTPIHHVTPKAVKTAFDSESDIRCVFITSPTYEGFVAEIKAIADIAHSHGAILIVDEAHGAHLPFNDMFPESSLYKGADIVIHGIHKTLPSLTQTALLHVASDRVRESEITRYLSVFQTSSPSYILTGSIDYCMDFLETDGKVYYERYCNNLKKLYQKLEDLKNICILPYDSRKREASKLVICTQKNVSDKASLNGLSLYKLLREKYNLQPEMSQPDYVIMMTSVWDDAADYDKLNDALHEIDEDISSFSDYSSINTNANSRYNNKTCNHTECTLVKPGDIADDIIYIYPPGIPIISAGETYTKEIIDRLNYYIENGYRIKSNKYH